MQPPIKRRLKQFIADRQFWHPSRCRGPMLIRKCEHSMSERDAASVNIEPQAKKAAGMANSRHAAPVSLAARARVQDL
jgi:hypothetical protein